MNSSVTVLEWSFHLEFTNEPERASARFIEKTEG